MIFLKKNKSKFPYIKIEDILFQSLFKKASKQLDITKKHKIWYFAYSIEKLEKIKISWYELTDLILSESNKISSHFNWFNCFLEIVDGFAQILLDSFAVQVAQSETKQSVWISESSSFFIQFNCFWIALLDSLPI